MVNARRKVIIDCDTGTDDAVAIIGLLMAEELEVIGITSVFGNNTVEEATDNNLRLTEFLGSDVPVYKGCPRPMVRDLTPGRHHNTLWQIGRKVVNGKEIRIHERTLPLPEPVKTAKKEHAVSFLVRTLSESQEPIDICAVGPLTNLALAFRMRPEIARRIGTLYIMGGGIYTGNRTPVGEANFVDDPEAAAIVLLSGANILLNPIEGNMAGATYGLKDIDRIEKLGNRTSVFTAELLRSFIHRCELLWGDSLSDGAMGSITECCIHDWAAVAPAIDPSVVTKSRKEICRVDISGGMADGQLVIDRRGYVLPANAEIVYDMDEKKCKKMLLDLIKKAI